MQEALARLCGQSINQIKGTRFEFYPRRDVMGQPLEAPHHPELKSQVDHLSFMMYDRQKELDNARAYANHKYAISSTRRSASLPVFATGSWIWRRPSMRETCNWRKGKMPEKTFMEIPTPISAMMMTFWRIRPWNSSPMRMI